MVGLYCCPHGDAWDGVRLSPLVVLHVTRVACRQSIKRRGLLAGQPAPGRPFGVYVYSDYVQHGTRGSSFGAKRVRWTSGPKQDVWQVAYIGRAIPDIYVENALILLDSVAPEYVTLVTGNN